MIRNLSRMARTTRASTRASTTSAAKVAHTSKPKAPSTKTIKKDGESSEPKIKSEAGESTERKGRKRGSTATASTANRNSKRVKRKETEEDTGLPSPSLSSSDAYDEPPSSPPPKKKVKQESTPKSKAKKTSSAEDLSAKKLKQYFAHANESPFPDFVHPTPKEAKLAHKILASLHGARTRPEKLVASKDRAGCGDSPSVLDALVRTILSQNTSDKNSTRAKRSMDEVYGGSDEWGKIVEGGQTKLQEAIKSGGLSVVKSKVIISILNQAKEKYGKYSLDHLHDASSEDAMREMLSFQGVGPKTASCVLLFCLQRESFAVDTHVHRITGLLGWRPKSADREATHSHLDARIPDEDKYGLHILLVKHGKVCEECKAGGRNLGKCELRKAFRQGKIKGEAGSDVKAEEIDKVKEEDAEEEWFGV